MGKVAFTAAEQCWPRIPQLSPYYQCVKDPLRLSSRSMMNSSTGATDSSVHT